MKSMKNTAKLQGNSSVNVKDKDGHNSVDISCDRLGSYREMSNSPLKQSLFTMPAPTQGSKVALLSKYRKAGGGMGIQTKLSPQKLQSPVPKMSSKHT